MTKTYNEIATLARDYARDNVRTHLTNNVRNNILAVEIAINEVDEDIKNLAKNKERVEFKISEVKDNNPDKEDILKKLNEDLKAIADREKMLTDEKANYNKKIELLKEEIEEIANGVKKVSKETLARLSAQYIDKITEELMLVDALKPAQE